MHAECRGTALKGVQGTEEVCCDMTDSFLSEMGIVVWHRRHPGGMLPENRSLDADGLELPNGFPDQGESTYGLEHVDLRTLDLPALARVVASCERCELHRSRTRTVFGNGAPDADLLIIGEAPGQNEDQQGEPFVGRAGQLLTRMLAALGLSRSAVYISNAVKCRPPSNRDPRREETEACSPFLDRQITLLRPRVILAVGRVAPLRDDLFVLPVKTNLVDLLTLEEVGIPWIENSHFLQHLANDDFDVFVVDFYRLQTVYVLDFVHQVLLDHVHTLNLEDVVRIDGAFGEALTSDYMVAFVDS